MTFEALVRWLSAPLVTFLLTVSPMVAAEHAAAEHPRKVTVVSFGLFGHQGVFRREATSAAQIVANRFGGGPSVVKFNSNTGGDATIKTLAATLQAEGKREWRERYSVSHPYIARLTRGPCSHGRSVS